MCYEMFGADFMVTSDIVVKLLEVNYAVSDDPIIEKIIEGIAQLILDPIFKPTIPSNRKLSFIAVDNIN